MSSNDTLFDRQREPTPLGSEETIAVSVLRSAINAVIVIDRNGLIRYCNPAVTKLLGYEQEELLNENVKKLMPDDIAAEHDHFIERYIQTGQAKVIGKGREVTVCTKDGTTFEADLTITETQLEDDIHFVGVLRDISDKRELEKENYRTIQVTSAINRMLDNFIGASLWNKRELFDEALSSLLRLSGSEYGFIGEILHTEEGSPYLKTHAITNIAWDAQTRKLYKENVRNGLEFYNLETLFGVTIRSGDMVITNQPSEDPRSGGLPPGHPPLNAYLGLPIYAGGQFVGMAGLANRASGYDEDIVDNLRPFLNSLGSMIVGFQNLEHKRRVEQDLYETQQKLRSLNQDLEAQKLELQFSSQLMTDQATEMTSLAEDRETARMQIAEANKRLEDEIEQRKQLEEELRLLATTDPLTGALNRRAFMELAQTEFSRARRYNKSVTVVMIDLDHFKSINDRFGHAAGDEALQYAVSVIEGETREQDSFGRLGGEEFAVLLPETKIADAKDFAERIRGAIEENTVKYDNHSFQITASLGLASFDDSDKSIEDLINRADSALYLAKDSGRNCIKEAA
jgi:diguanylate cyclase (GGDEF)-like protein/PAS domain S-box-containing protein